LRYVAADSNGKLVHRGKYYGVYGCDARWHRAGPGATGIDSTAGPSSIYLAADGILVARERMSLFRIGFSTAAKRPWEVVYSLAASAVQKTLL
jgi:hypothetical protein